MQQHFASKADARRAIWDRLEAEKLARFPFPPHGRIPNFAGAREAAERLFESPLFAKAKRIKVNPDAPQRAVRELALERGLSVYVATPRLRGGFRLFDPANIPKAERKKAASLGGAGEYGKDVPLAEVPEMQLDAIVVGSVVVMREGYRLGKGEGYADLEYAVLRELGHRPVPVATTIHAAQIVRFFPVYDHDVPLELIVTPEESIAIDNPSPAPRGIDWERLPEERLDEMPILRELQLKKKRRRSP